MLRVSDVRCKFFNEDRILSVPLGFDTEARLVVSSTGGIGSDVGDNYIIIIRTRSP